jgi:large subunit ribosomal protein L23
MSKNPYQVIEKPIITEKGLDVKERARTLCFRVNRHATKTEIKAAVQAVFKVKVASVHTSLQHGKKRVQGRSFGFRPDWKKAYVKLKAGEKMPEYAENV